jgi:TetR/AcrR family transcriptional regulator, transcriptional repressor for nem operon
MKVSKAQSAENRQAVLDAAARLYLERGLGGVGVAEISREAGFTHGGFYGRFASKDEFAAEACALAFEAPLARLQASLQKHGGDARPYFQNYLTPRHRDDAGGGCPMPALATDAARAQGPVPEALTRGIGAYLETLACHRPDGGVVEVPSSADKARAITSLSALVGGMVLARATAEAAPALSDEILAVLQAQIGEFWIKSRGQD